ncbi:hypothetical protein AMAG_17620 [Allomyces macrogynus ATCC 38327]|uniref:P/Homo B domain-containing protein n=1 Tax=Allomyces macrogynus (strain ATCC 38327) TaxID=578462 RepID=A0A0L0RUL9_ALLM3|nr:hypothetical protein AMAG_17620 [Allomyces macrogynus ATCC 38327]|eukprot:KNE54077.1 hypothetical protein AMAG_17620 [Allomyces macrogynus ATCC 38327]
MTLPTAAADADTAVPSNALPPLSYQRPSSPRSVRDGEAPGSSNDTLAYYAATFNRLSDARDAIARWTGAHLVGRIGELSNVYLFAVPSGIIDRITRSVGGGTEWVPMVRRRNLFHRAVPTESVAARTASAGTFSDPLFMLQWHLLNRVQATNDLDIFGTWRSGITGDGVTVGLVDEGVEYTHPDIAPNFDASLSYDFNTHAQLPQLPLDNSETHGTRCAGEIVAAADNSVCGVGVAYGAKLAGIRILAGPVTIADEAAALNYQYQRISVYSNSWGPNDDGETVDAPSSITASALLNGVTNGRGGKGVIYVWAAGNGGDNGDNCNYDGYANNPWSMAIGALDMNNQTPFYGEPCPSIMGVAYSGNSNTRLTTTDNGASCTASHSGTSAAAPLASGISALLLSARPELTWRDVHDIFRKSAIPVNPSADWTLLPSGLRYSTYYGYGKLDVSRALATMQRHTLLGPQSTLTLPAVTVNQRVGDMLPPVVVQQAVTDTRRAGEYWTRVERVGVTVWVDHQQRGDLAYYLTSPMNVTSVLATPRPQDTSADGLNGWRFMSVMHWGEPVSGTWTLKVVDTKDPAKTGTVRQWQLSFWSEVVANASTALPPGSLVEMSTPTASPSPLQTCLTDVWCPPVGQAAIAGIIIGAVAAVVGIALIARRFRTPRTADRVPSESQSALVVSAKPTAPAVGKGMMLGLQVTSMAYAPLNSPVASPSGSPVRAPSSQMGTPVRTASQTGGSMSRSPGPATPLPPIKMPASVGKTAWDGGNGTQ